MYELLFVCRSRLVDVESEWGGTTRISLKIERADLKYIMHSKLFDLANVIYFPPPCEFSFPQKIVEIAVCR